MKVIVDGKEVEREGYTLHDMREKSLDYFEVRRKQPVLRRNEEAIHMLNGTTVVVKMRD